MLLPLIVWKITTCDYVPTTSTFPTQVFFQHASFKSVSSNCEKRSWQAVWNHKLFRLLASRYSEMFTCWLVTAHNKNTPRAVEKKVGAKSAAASFSSLDKIELNYTRRHWVYTVNLLFFLRLKKMKKWPKNFNERQQNRGASISLKKNSVTPSSFTGRPIQRW